MSVNTRDVPCPAVAVLDVLADGWLLGLWVVGASRIRAVDADWPAVGATVHHSVGVWPLLLDDTSVVRAFVPGRSITLRARGWPAGEADVQIDVVGTAAGCRVTMIEDAVKGAGLLVPEPLRSALLHARNAEALSRLAYVAQNR